MNDARTTAGTRSTRCRCPEWAYWYRHERAARICDGADEVHKTSLGRRLLRRYAAAATAESDG